MNQVEPLTLNQAVKVSGLSRSTLKRHLHELESWGSYKLPSGEWRIPEEALTALMAGSDGSRGEPREPGSVDPREPLREPAEPREPGGVGPVVSWEDVAEARTAAREWQARAEERAARIEELAKRAEQAEARLDQMLANQTAMALAMKEQQHLLAQAQSSTPLPAEPEPERTPEASSPEPAPTASVKPETTTSADSRGGKVRRWFRG